MRTFEEIVRKAKDSGSFFGFDRQVYVSFLPFPFAAQFLTEDARNRPNAAEEWNKDVSPLTEEKLMDELRGYMDFAWGKALDHRGLSANRSIEKLTAYVWLLGNDALIAELESVPYENYGCPKLMRMCEVYNLPIPDVAEAVRMADGLPCEPGCRNGCGNGSGS